MNKTAFALALLALATLMPWPTGQAVQINDVTDCLPPVAPTVQEVVTAVRKAVPDPGALPQDLQGSSSSKPVEVPCLGPVDCESIVPSVRVLDLADPCQPDARLCPYGEVGASVNGVGRCVPVPGVCTSRDCLPDCEALVGQTIDQNIVDVCHPDVQVPTVRLCPDGQVGANVNGRAHCEPAQVPPTPTPPPGNDPPPGAACQTTHDDNGFGGTQAHCDYHCRTGDTLGIYVHAHDDKYGTADAGGRTRCGGTQANCDVHPVKNICSGISHQPAQSNEYEQDCEGHSKEAFDSPVTVACYAIGVSTLCNLLHLCDSLPTSNVMAICELENGAIAGLVAEAGLGAIAMLPLSSFTLVHNVGSGSTLAAGWINDAGQVHCITGTAAGN